MSEAPETIWTCNHVGEYGRHFPEAVEAEGEYGGTAVSYRRADLPPTLSAAMELPEVKALVDAATALLVQVDGLIPIKHPQQKLERNKLRHAITALAAIKETKT